MNEPGLMIKWDGFNEWIYEVGYNEKKSLCLINE